MGTARVRTESGITCTHYRYYGKATWYMQTEYIISILSPTISSIPLKPEDRYREGKDRIYTGTIYSIENSMRNVYLLLAQTFRRIF